MAAIGTTKIGCDFGNGGGGSSGYPVPDSGILTISSDDFAASVAFSTIQNAGGIVGNEILTMELPNSNGTPIEDELVFDGWDHSQIIFKGQTPTVGLISAFSSLSGAPGAYQFTFTAPADVCADAAIHGYVTIETINIPSTYDHLKPIGTCEVVSTTETTVTVTNKCMDPWTALPTPSNDYQAVVHKTIYTASSSTSFMLLMNRSVSPTIKDVLFIGDGSQTLVYAEGGSKVFTDNNFGNSSFHGNGTFGTDPVHSLAVYNGSTNMVIVKDSTFSGSLSSSGGATSGVYAQRGDFYVNGFQSCHNSFFGLYLASSSSCRAGDGYNSSVGSYTTGNGTQGISITNLSKMDTPGGGSAGNVSEGVRCSQTSDFQTGSSTWFTLDTTSPAVNTLGNYNSYIRRS